MAYKNEDLLLFIPYLFFLAAYTGGYRQVVRLLRHFIFTVCLVIEQRGMAVSAGIDRTVQHGTFFAVAELCFSGIAAYCQFGGLRAVQHGVDCVVTAIEGIAFTLDIGRLFTVVAYLYDGQDSVCGARFESACQMP